MTKVGLDTIGTSTTLESNKSLERYFFTQASDRWANLSAVRMPCLRRNAAVFAR